MTKTNVHDHPPCAEHGFGHPFNECPTMHYNDGESAMTACGQVWSGQVECAGWVDAESVNCDACLAALSGWKARWTPDELEPAGEQMTIEKAEESAVEHVEKRVSEGQWSRLQKLAEPIAVSAPCVEIDHLTELIQQAELMRAQAIDRARAMETSWATIGVALGVSKQAAAQKYGKKR